MLQEEVMRRVPLALEEQGGPWRLLAWLEQIQPSMPLADTILPSYGLRLLAENLSGSRLTLSAPKSLESTSGNGASGNGHLPVEEARTALLQVAERAIEAEEEHILNSVTNLLDQSQDRLEDQLAERLDTLDTFIEGLRFSDETDIRHPKELQDELNNLLHIPINLDSRQLKALRENPDEVSDELRDQVENQTMEIAVTRLIGAVERILRESLGLDVSDLEDGDWNQLGDQVLDAIEDLFEGRKSRYLGNGAKGQIVKDLDTQFSKLDDPEISEKGLLNLMVLMPQGRRAAFDKKTHRRVWQRTTRMTYIYLAAGMLEGREPEQVAEDVLAHLEEVQAVIRRVWGLSEIGRLAAVRPIDMDEDVIAGLHRSLGEQIYQQIAQQPLQTLKGDLLEQVVDELGRSALTKLYRQLLLRVISELWVEYLTQMEALRVSIGLEAYAQRDPLVQYKTRAFQMFQDLLGDMRMSVVTRMFTFQPRDLSSVQASVSRQEPPPIKEKTQPSRASRGKRRRRRRRR